MARGGGREQREGNALKTALVVTGGLVLVWVTVETAFGSFLSRLRNSIARSDPNTDPDDDVDSPGPATSAPTKDKDDPESVVVDEPEPYTGGRYQDFVPGQVDSEVMSDDSYNYE